MERTAPTLGLPLITLMAMEERIVSAAVESATPALSAGDRQGLGIRGIERIKMQRYLAVPYPNCPNEIQV